MGIDYIYHPDAPTGEPPLAARAGDFVFFAGGIAAHPTRGILDEVKPQPAYPHHVTNIERQLRYIYKDMVSTLEAAGSSMAQVMQINSFLVRDEEIHMYQRLKADYFGTETPPPSTRAMIAQTAVRGATVTNDLTALALNAALDREAVHRDTDRTPLPVHDLLFGHPQYVQAVGASWWRGYRAGRIGGISPRMSFASMQKPRRACALPGKGVVS